MQVSLKESAKWLRKQDHILILTHQSPDGDTLGSAAALCLGLLFHGKQARIACADPIPEKYGELLSLLPCLSFEPQTVIAVDVADRKLLGTLAQTVGAHVDLCIDHHGSNTQYAERFCVQPQAAATCEMVYDLLNLLKTPITPPIANCLFLGLSTDTGCFRYSNTTPQTMRIAAELMEKGAQAAEINRQMFEIKTRSRLELERMALDQMEYLLDGHCAMMTISLEMIQQSGATEGDLEGLAPLPRNVEGVRVGLTLRQKGPESYKVSVRSGTHVNAAKLCARLGGGGHPQAAGCMLHGPLPQVKQKLLEVTAEFLNGATE